MITKGSSKSPITHRVKATLATEPGLSVKDLAERLKVNRQFMAGFLAALEEMGLVMHRQVGPARTYFSVDRR
ncbi:MAG: MarR family transcriptional regulator [Chloroflexi bacterium]|nr:MarR family transcriptional regulator [Chloroflexota bacterium]